MVNSNIIELHVKTLKNSLWGQRAKIKGKEKQIRICRDGVDGKNESKNTYKASQRCFL
jgi:hypothetical protein